jgi:hypothetical protein
MEENMDFHLRVRRWVFDWFVIGVVCGIVVLVNVFFRKPSADDVALSLFFGGLYWVIGGIICYGLEGVKFEPPHAVEHGETIMTTADQRQYHCASDFVLPGNSRHLFPRRR